ncbi:hypothetical protein [Rubrivivax gelatinosus]|uniref:hypothetical protein n=1 Tax=Rubrivivax gelatinosus TaxID=28068 RepID=UPI0003053074|nr:hypothetical protein [Rubrivivax gelatinosus]MBG6083220.1 hypothetical protein [Rubrivivax gelatinosus]
MSITLVLKDGTGSLFPNADSNKPSAPKLEGFFNFKLDDRDEGPTLRLDAAAWIKEKDGLQYYSLSVGGLNGALFPEQEKKTDNTPDYSGTLGPNRELRVVGWKKVAEATGAPYVSLLVSEPNKRGSRVPQKGHNPAFI